MFDFSNWQSAIDAAANPHERYNALHKRSNDLLKIAHTYRDNFIAVLPCAVDIYNFESCRAAIADLDTAAQASAWQLYAAYRHAFCMFWKADHDAQLLTTGLDVADLD